MARTYDAIKGPGVITRSRAIGQPASPRGKVLVNSGWPTEDTAFNRKKSQLINRNLWVDASYTNPGGIWLAGGVAMPPSVGASNIYN